SRARRRCRGAPARAHSSRSTGSRRPTHVFSSAWEQMFWIDDVVVSDLTRYSIRGTMRPMHRIVVDAMGGDHAPDEVVHGAAEASLALHNAEIILVGDAAVIGRLLPRMRHDGARVRVHHAPAYVEMD